MANVQPTKYILSGKDLSVTYIESWFREQPWFTYKDAHQTMNFSGDEIRLAKTELGKLVSVTTKKTIDTLSTTFSVLLPDISLQHMRTRQVFDTIGVKTLHKTELVVPTTGPRETYDVVKLEGEASVVEILAATEAAA